MTNLPDIAQRLRDCAEDPMWADHAEVPKVWLWEASAEIERFAARVAKLEAEVANSHTIEELWRNEALKAQQMLVEAQQK